MKLMTIAGTYRNGAVHLGETPPDVEEARVLVTFLPREPLPEPKMMTFGMLRVEGRPESTEEDFKLAEWHPKPEDLLDE
ncbi:MAG TPA: hypothetical protein VGI81_03220 [Tepidisphaeraceae bacterium]|jgi:hypothetical protein